MTRVEDLPTAPFDDADGEERATYGRFVSINVIGRGGMGIVVRARDPELDRQVAIKVLGPRWSETAAARLVREAQAMAKLAHPNIVAVYEMGQVGAQTFIAMELVEGVTLRRWLETRRPVRAILDAFVACGRGLAAAHAAGLVHRDFKPENVLIGADDRPRVSDFGLVADARDANDRAIMGTPAYMAPEQWRGEAVDARADQFSFCVALWEALYGERPFPTDGRDAIREPPRDRRDALLPILKRGLALDREERWPSMEALVDAIRPRTPRWPFVAGGVAVLGAIAATYAFASSGSTSHPDPCPGAADLVALDRASIERSFATANPAIAGDVTPRVLDDLERYRVAWVAGRRDACRATRVDGVQSPELLDRRTQCLDARRAEFAALTRSFATIDRAGVAKAIDATGSLGDLAQCADVEALSAAKLPTSPRQRERVLALTAEIAASSQSRFDYKPKDRLVRATAALDAARAIDDGPTVVAALEEVAYAAKDAADFETRESALRELAKRAAEVHDDRRQAIAWIELMRVLAARHQDVEAKALDPVAEAALARADNPTKLRFGLERARGSRLMRAMDFAAAIEAYRRALAIASSELDRADMLLAIAQVTNLKDGPKAATPDGETALATFEKAFGSSHPRTADALHTIASFAIAAGDIAKAEKLETRSLAIREAALGPTNLDVAYSLHVLAVIAESKGDAKTARAMFERAIAIFDGEKRPADAALSRGHLAPLVWDAEGADAARKVFDRALADFPETGADRLNFAGMASNYGQMLLEVGKCSEARPLFARAMKVFEESSPRQIPIVLDNEARCDLADHHVERAITKFERGRAICNESDCHPDLRGQLAWMLGKALVESGRDRARGKALIDEAIGFATTAHDTELLDEIAKFKRRGG